MFRFIRPWKKRTAYWYIANALHTEPPRQGPDVKLKSPLKRIAILTDGGEQALVDLSRRMEREFKDKGCTVRSLFHFSDYEEHPGLEDQCFQEADLHWNGLPNARMEELMGRDNWDLLLCLSGDQCLPILLLAARWKADVKVGMQASWPFFDIVLEGHVPPYSDFSAHWYSVFQTLKPSVHEQA